MKAGEAIVGANVSIHYASTNARNTLILTRWHLPLCFYLWPALRVVLVTLSLRQFVGGAAILLPPRLEGGPENPVDEEHVGFDRLAAS